MQWPSPFTLLAFVATLWASHAGAKAKTDETISLMVVGDSIAHGFEGDFTWRYRLREWFVNQNISATFVGPHNGTFPQLQKKRGPTCIEESQSEVPEHIIPVQRKYPRPDGGYAEAADQHWPSAHHCLKGQLASLLNLTETAALYTPDYILLQLGINDLIKESEPVEVVQELRRLVEEVRAARADTRFAIATIAMTRDFPALPNLFWSIEETSDLLESAMREWSTETSPVSLVQMRDVYQCNRQTCLPSWDGVHPNEAGEYQMASAFSDTLHHSFGLGSEPLRVPEHDAIPERPTTTPANLQVKMTSTGIKVTWDRVFNAHQYDISMRPTGATDWRTRAVQGVLQWDALDVKDGEEWEFRVRVNNAEYYGQPRHSDWTPSMSVVAHPSVDACGRERVVAAPERMHWFQSQSSTSLVSIWFLLSSIILFGVVYNTRSRMPKHHCQKS